MQRFFLLLLALPLLTSFQQAEQHRHKVYLIGDSTMADKDIHKYPETGWGMPFKNYFDSAITVINAAMNGRSTKSFLAENRWQPIYTGLHPGDYVFIQFGHNDEAKEKKERYTPPEEYKTNLKKFIRETREKKAIPVLMTPVARRRFEGDNVVESHAVYAALVREVAAEEKTAFIDMDEKSQALLQSFGAEPSKLLYLQLAAGENPNYPEGVNDNTHFSELGARKIAQIVINELRSMPGELAQHIYKPEPKKK